MLVQVAQGIGLVAQAKWSKARVLFGQRNTGGQYFGRLAAIQSLENGLEHVLALDDFFQPLGQACAVERLGQVRIRFPLQGADHHGLAVFGRDHDKHAFVADQPVGHQVFKYLLAVFLAITEVEVMQDEVIALLGAQAQRLLAGVGGVHFLHPQLAQHGPDRATKIGEIVDDQKAFLVPRQHRDSCQGSSNGPRCNDASGCCVTASNGYCGNDIKMPSSHGSAHEEAACSRYRRLFGKA
ncbi:hypothetical protein D3C76_1000280 [compost metagenome]